MADEKRFPLVVSDISEVIQTNYIGFASFAMLIFDHFITFADEVEYIWKGQKGPVVYLFLLNRYLTPLGFIVNLFAYTSPTLSQERCRHFVRYEGAMTTIGIEVVGIMMLLRIKALYGHHRQRWIVRGVFALLMFETAMNAWLLTHGEAVTHNPAFHIHSCTMIFPPSMSAVASSSAWIPLVYDTTILGLTLYRTWPSLTRKDIPTTNIMKRLVEDGLVYYSAIFAANATLTVMIASAPPGLKNITAQLELLLTVAMMSRITLNLKRAARCTENDTVLEDIVFAVVGSESLFPHRYRRYTLPGAPAAKIVPREGWTQQSNRGIPLRPLKSLEARESGASPR